MKKLTDNEIIKALECCSIDNHIGVCKECPFADVCDEDEQALQKHALDLINRQKEEIDRLNIELQSMRSAANSYKMHYETAKSEAIKEFADRLKHEITSAIDTYYNSNGGGYYLAEDVIDDIDNLVKEMTEVQK